MNLSPGQLEALQNLGRKQGGETTDWINISDARSLTELGLAERHSSGWQITKSGSALLAGESVEAAADEATPPSTQDPLPFKSPKL